MKIHIKGKGSLELNQNHFKADGGEAKVYVKDKIAYKIYHDHNKSVPEAKMRELSCLIAPNIIKPELLVLDHKGQNIGYTMKYVDDVYSLVQLFPKAFKTREGLNPDKVIGIVQQLQAGIAGIHSHKILLVDINENNFLVSKKFDETYFIDVDSYMTPSFDATAISDLIRDRHCTKFTELSDWFSFAIIAFQLFRGIHPYRGTHPKWASLDDRMLHNISILNQEVKYPQNAVIDEGLTPQSYREWFLALFEEQKRIPPPNSLGLTSPAIVSKVTSIAGNLFDLIELNCFKFKDFKETPTQLYRSGNHLIVRTKDCVVVDKGFNALHNGTGVIGFAPKSNTPILAFIDKGQIFTTNMNGGHIPCNIWGEALMEYDGRIFIKNKGNLLELQMVETGGRVVLAGKVVCQIMENASILWPGLLIQNMLGSIFATIFPKVDEVRQIHLKELDGSRIIEAKFDSGILQVVALRANKYDRYIFKISGAAYTFRVYEDISYAGLNFVTLANGICVSSNEDGSIEAFSNSKNNDKIKHLTDPMTSGMILMKDEISIVVYNNDRFYQLKMR